MSNNANIYTELLAICKFKECLLRTKHIVPIVKEIDKEPVWDGNLYVYKEKGNVNNKSLIDSIPIQVKGTCKNRISNKLSYPIRTDDLEKFESNGGCIYFVVVLNNSGKRFSVFYKLLLPFDILSIMQGKENQSTINVHMNKLDINNISQMLSLFKSFINDRKKQGGTAKQGLKLREQLYTGKTNKDLNIKEFNLSFSANAWDNIPTYIYAKDNNEVELPIDCVLFKEISTNLYTEIEIGSDVHFCNTQLIKSAKDEYLIIENSIYISKNHKTLKFKFSDKLEERIAALNIMKSLYSNNTINIKNVLKMSIDIKHLIPITELCDTLNYHIKIKKALQMIKAPLNLSFNNFSEDDLYKIHLLVSSLVDNKSFKRNTVTTDPLAIMNIGNLCLLIQIEKKSNGEFIIKPADFINTNIKVSYDNIPNIKYPISACIIFKKHDWATIDNLPYDDIYKSIITPSYFKETIGNINNTLLDIIAAFDESKKTELLNLAIKISQWIKDNETYEYSLINYYQCIKRERPLTDTEKSISLDMKYKCKDDICNFGISVLLDNADEANYIWSKLSSDNQETLKSFPIFTLYTNMIET